MAAYRIITFAMSVLLGGYIAHFAMRTLCFWGLEIKKRYSRIAITVLSVLVVEFCQTAWGMGAVIVLHIMQYRR